MPDRYAECDTLIPQKNNGEDKTAALYYVKEQL